MLAGALGYLVVGRDIVPDDIPLLGGLDDLVVVVLAVDLFLDGVPTELLDEKLAELGIDRRGVRRGRRPHPALDAGPASAGRSAAFPELVASRGDALEQQSGVGPRVRAWINKEESIA